MTPIVIGIAGPVPTADERSAIARMRPAGIILFARNVAEPAQLRALTDALRDAAGEPRLAILIDQEGGRVARLGPPHWPAFPAASLFGEAYARAPMTAIRAARAQGEAIGATLAAAGITMNAAPVLDLAHGDADPALAGRALAADPLAVAALGRAMVEGMAAAGVTAIVKHLPGHGRARTDPHVATAIVAADAGTLAGDLGPFRRLAGLPAAMVGHVVYPAWDPGVPASLSPVVIGQVIRGAIGFGGLLLSDDLHMGALSGPLVDRAAAAIAAGCDLALCCHASPAEVLALAARLGDARATTIARLERARPAPPTVFDPDEAIVRRDTLLAAGNGAVRLALPGGNA